MNQLQETTITEFTMSEQGATETFRASDLTGKANHDGPKGQ